MRLYAVGDIHGCYDKLKSLLSKLPLSDEDLLIFLGDYIDRGPDSRKVIDYLLELKMNRQDKVIFLKGNHEKMFLDYLNGKNKELFLLNGGQSTIEQYEEEGVLKIPDAHLDFFHSLKTIYVTEKYVFVHAGLKPAVSIDWQQDDDLLWIRGDFIFSDFDFKKKVIFGHTPMKSFQPFFDKNKIGIDTGAVYGGFLTAIQLPEEKIYQA